VVASVIIPTLQAELFLPELVRILRTQSLPPKEIIIIDSCSDDRTVPIALHEGCKVHIIPQNDFRHGRARNSGARLASGDILVFLTQDVLPANEYFLEELTRPIKEGWASAATARQIPYPDAHPVEKFSRQFNYPPESNLHTLEDLPRFGIKTVFFSNSASAIEKGTFWQQGGFSENLIVNEDMDICARMLLNDHAVAYQSTAKVYHSHNYTLGKLFSRYFDIGVFFDQSRHLLGHVSRVAEGKKFAVDALNHLVSNSEWGWAARFILETSIKFLAFNLGNRYHRLPDWMSRSFSGHKNFWDS
jgi:rhamnosyltransferase